MKVVHLKDISDVKAEDVVPGMILAEGIVIDTERQVTHGKRPDVIFFYTAATSHTGFANVGKTVQVYGRIDASLVDALVKTYKRTA